MMSLSLVCYATAQNHITDFAYLSGLAAELKQAYRNRIGQAEFEDFLGRKQYKPVPGLYGDLPRWEEVEALLNEAFSRLNPESNLRWNGVGFYETLRSEVLRDSNNSQPAIPVEARSPLLEIMETAEAWECECWRAL
jgi:hypothetical protein